jgi:pimeloyl-ACP methyl ester carboxylesterase
MSTVHPFAPRTPARETLICLHSSGSSGRQWAPIAVALSSRFEVITPDLLGYAGTRPWPAGTPASIEDEAVALAPLLNAGGVHLFGHSYGGAVALQIALRWPERVKSLTLYEPVRFALLFRDPQTAAAGESIVGVGRRIGLEVLSGALETAAARFVDYWSGAGTWQQLAPRSRRVLAGRMRKVQAEFEALFADRVPAVAYAALAMPVHLMGGSRSPLPARQVLDVLAANCRHARRTTLAGLGHMGPVDAPQRILDAFDAPIRERVIAQAA